MNYILLILFIIILLIIFTCKEVLTIKSYIISKVSKLISDIKNDNDEFSTKLQNNMTSCITQIKNIGSNNLRELQKINLLNKQPITKVINHFTETDPIQNDQTNYYMSSGNEEHKDNNTSDTSTINNNDTDCETLSSTSSSIKEDLTIPIYNYQEHVITMFNTETEQILFEDLLNYGKQESHNLPQIEELDSESIDQLSLPNKVPTPQLLSAIDDNELQHDSPNVSNYETNDTISSQVSDTDDNDDFDDFPVYTGTILTPVPNTIDEDLEPVAVAAIVADGEGGVVDEEPVVAVADGGVVDEGAVVDEEVAVVVDEGAVVVDEGAVVYEEPVVAVAEEGAVVVDELLSLDEQLRNLNKSVPKSKVPLDARSMKSCLSVVTDVPCDIVIDFPKKKTVGKRKRLSAIGNYTLADLKELCKEMKLPLSEKGAAFNKTQLYDRLKKSYNKK